MEIRYFDREAEYEDEEIEVDNDIKSGIVEIYCKYPAEYYETVNNVDIVTELSETFVVCCKDGHTKTYDRDKFLWIEAE